MSGDEASQVLSCNGRIWIYLKNDKDSEEGIHPLGRLPAARNGATLLGTCS